jgi:hypothetical protein
MCSGARGKANKIRYCPHMRVSMGVCPCEINVKENIMKKRMIFVKTLIIIVAVSVMSLGCTTTGNISSKYSQFNEVKNKAHEDVKPILDEIYHVVHLYGMEYNIRNSSICMPDGFLRTFFSDDWNYIDKVYGEPYTAMRGKQSDVEKRAAEASDEKVGQLIIYLREVYLSYAYHVDDPDRLKKEADEALHIDYMRLPKSERIALDAQYRFGSIFNDGASDLRMYYGSWEKYQAKRNDVIQNYIRSIIQ